MNVQFQYVIFQYSGLLCTTSFFSCLQPQSRKVYILIYRPFHNSIIFSLMARPFTPPPLLNLYNYTLFNSDWSQTLELVLLLFCSSSPLLEIPVLQSQKINTKEQQNKQQNKCFVKCANKKKKKTLREKINEKIKTFSNSDSYSY